MLSRRQNFGRLQLGLNINVFGNIEISSDKFKRVFDRSNAFVQVELECNQLKTVLREVNCAI